jgi:hypothetical protein
MIDSERSAAATTYLHLFESLPLRPRIVLAFRPNQKSRPLDADDNLFRRPTWRRSALQNNNNNDDDDEQISRFACARPVYLHAMSRRRHRKPVSGGGPRYRIRILTLSARRGLLVVLFCMVAIRNRVR